MIEIHDLRVECGGKTICSVDQLTVGAGEHLAIVGPNGSGKTTLLRVLAGLTAPSAGQCQIAVDLRRRTYVHQQPYLFRGTALSNVRYGEGRKATDWPDATRWMERLGVDRVAQQSARDLSGGEARRVALARALACQPTLLLVDEPFADLDDDASLVVCNTLNHLGETTLIVASPTKVPPPLTTRMVRLP